ncbi:hypothetical protein BCR41DRAFT_103813 [Lobosporangium transversale]|uniref:GPI anchored protein n=1 Tax=Lobosporangium transversale TaxID=64571 RepID=A0A1Y2GIT4_9FUNG|nr:hypothetical protein BCR41DRAFT_103813 [Lobosporangium transversale]ORZ12061.1 hypothetical protein BCR41DRAFT_103813 [Lobosporangium transversale]|eukprot:XP_021879926.1 hypothetical protein BCR41DRAFT_103813 [Lobosporangium transversale]
MLAASIRALIIIACSSTFLVTGIASPETTSEALRIVSPNTAAAAAAGKIFLDSGYNAFTTLGQGSSYQPSLSAVRSLAPIFANSSSTLDKRADCNCPPGFGCCSNGKCCPGGTLCSITAGVGGCCDSLFPFTCGEKYCCPYGKCTSEGHCGCPMENEVRCGNNCCLYGCAANGVDCACPSTHPVVCPNQTTCCPANSMCTADGKCSAGAKATTRGNPFGPTLPASSSLPTTTSGSQNPQGTGIDSTSPSSANSNSFHSLDKQLQGLRILWLMISMATFMGL